MAEPRWQRTVDSLLRLAQDAGATDAERETARRKIRLILERHPEAERIRQYPPMREFTLGDVGFMKRNGISLEGSWTGGNLEEAARAMIAEYRRRIAAHDAQPRQITQ